MLFAGAILTLHEHPPLFSDARLLHARRPRARCGSLGAYALSAFRNYLSQYVTGEAAVVFKDITIPVLSINARLWPTAPDENRKHIKDYQLIYIEGTGHFPMLEKPEEFNMLLKKAISSIDYKK